MGARRGDIVVPIWTRPRNELPGCECDLVGVSEVRGTGFNDNREQLVRELYRARENVTLWLSTPFKFQYNRS